MKILLVEDDRNQLDLLTHYLECLGFLVHPLSCVDAALAALRNHSFDAVVTDYHLRDKTGCEIVRAAHERGLPSIFVTGSADRDEIARSVNLGARFVFLKPYSAEELADRIREAVMENSVRGKVKSVLRKTFGTE